MFTKLDEWINYGQFEPMENLDHIPSHLPPPSLRVGHERPSTVNQRCVALLHEMIEHKHKAARWEDGFYPISAGSTIRPGRPHLMNHEVQVLIAAGLVSHIPTSHNPNIPDNVLRILDQDIGKAEGIIMTYLRGLLSA
jgi:hypothetical protein